MENFADILVSAVREKGNPCVVGLDFHEQGLPNFVTHALRARPTPQGYRETISEYFKLIIETVAPLVAIVKPQIAFLESLTWVGAQVFGDIIDTAKKHGLIVIADAKRGDIASSAEGYAKAFLTPNVGNVFSNGYDAHAVTLNAFLGRDSIEPYLDACKKFNKGVFILVKTSNKGSVETQDLVLAESREAIYATYARTVSAIGDAFIGKSGYSSIGAVVGATFPQQARQIRALMPRNIILVPGYGSQGATAKDVAVNFNPDGLGAIVNASRSITHKFPNPDVSPEGYRQLVRENVIRMVNDIVTAIPKG